MIKIIISGTYDGFSPRYASDGDLTDKVTLHILDRRRYLSRDASRLDKEGYSFQQLAGLGILYHKIILLYDGFGRDGFMMASLFLPENEMLSGQDIKDALDSIIKDYRIRIQNGMVNVELDWSFIKKYVDELNTKVQSMPWKKHPSKTISAKTALIKGAEYSVADYFQYPNPLHDGCADFEQVFLTESILDPTMASQDGEQGYNVLTTDTVDITNTEYIIEFKNRLDQSGSFEGRKNIKKKELLQQGGIPIGTYSKQGYRTADVFVRDGEKISKDNLSITVTLPTLEKKRAKIRIKIFDKDTQHEITDKASVDWRISSGYNLSPISEGNGIYTFEGECCDKEWKLTIICDSYEPYFDNFIVADKQNEAKRIVIQSKPLWYIVYILPDGKEVQSSYIGVSDDVLDIKIIEVKEDLKKNGYFTDDRINKDEQSHKIILKCKRKDFFSDSDSVKLEDVTDNHHISHTASGKKKDLETKKEKFFCKLNEESYYYLLFKKYRKKLKLKDNILNSLKQIEEEIEEFKKNESFFKKGKEFIDCIKNGLKENKFEQAKQLLNELYYNVGKEVNKRDFWGECKKILKDVERYKRLSGDVILKPDDITYDAGNHRLECERTESPSTTEQIEFGKDRYKYSILSTYWEKEGEGGEYNSIVHKRLLPKYRTAYISIPIVAFLVIVVIGLCIKKNEDVADIRARVEKMIDECKDLSCNEKINKRTRYIGDSQFTKLDSLHQELMKFVEEHQEYKDSVLFNSLDSTYNIQLDCKRNDSIVCADCKKVLNNPNLDLIKWDSLLNDPALSKEHYDELNNFFKQKLEKEKGIKDDLKNKCLGMSGTVKDIKQYFDLYGEDDDLGKHLVVIAKDLSKDKQERLDACNLYLNHWNKGENSQSMKSLKEELTGRHKRIESDIEIVQEKVQNTHKEIKDNNLRNSLDTGNEKINITTAGDLFIALKWQNIKDFDSKYKVYNNLNSRKENIIRAAQNKKRKEYNTAYNKASEVKNDFDKLTALEKELGLKKK